MQGRRIIVEHTIQSHTSPQSGNNIRAESAIIAPIIPPIIAIGIMIIPIPRSQNGNIPDSNIKKVIINQPNTKTKRGKNRIVIGHRQIPQTT